MFTKKFCCSNEPETVAKILACIDMVFSIIMMVILLFFVHIYLYYPESLRKMTEEHPERQEDLIKFLAWSGYKQILMLSVPFLGSLLNGIMGLILYIGASNRNLRVVKIWLIFTLIFFVSSKITFLPKVIFTQDKGILIILFLLDWIYEIYSLWVVKCLFFKLLGEKRGESNKSYVTNSTVITNSTATFIKENEGIILDEEVGERSDKF